MASPKSYNRRPTVVPPSQSTGPTPGKFSAVSHDDGVDNADRIPLYVAGIIIGSAGILVGIVIGAAGYQMYKARKK